MAVGDPIDSLRLAGSDVERLEQQRGILCGQRSQWDRAEAADREPCRHGLLATRQKHARPARQRGNEHLAQPGVHEPEHFVVVECDDRRCRGQPLDERLQAVRAERCKETALRRLDRSAVELHDVMVRSAKLLEQPADKGRLPDAWDAVHVHSRVLTLMDELL